MKERLTGERFVPDEHAKLPSDEAMARMGVRSLSRLKEIKGIHGEEFDTQFFEQQVEFVDGWKYNLVHTKIPREFQDTDVTAIMTTPWTINYKRGFMKHTQQNVASLHMESSLASTPQNLNKFAGDYEANARNYARVPQLAAEILGEGERDSNNGIVIGDSRGANYGEGIAAVGPQHGFHSWYNELRVACQINGVPESIELLEMCRGMSPNEIAEKFRKGEIPEGLNPVAVSKLLFNAAKRLYTTFGPELTPVVDLVRDPVSIIAQGGSLNDVARHTSEKLRIESLDIPSHVLRHYSGSIDIGPRGFYRQIMEFLPLTDGSYGRVVEEYLPRYQFQYITGNSGDGLSLFDQIEDFHPPEKYPHTVTNQLSGGRHLDIVRGNAHTSRLQRLGLIIPMIIENEEKFKSMRPEERAKSMHELAARALPDVFEGNNSIVAEDYSASAA